MRNKNYITGAAASVGMLILILDGKTALNGAQAGIELCLRTVIPSLFPFILLSILLTDAFLGTDLPLLRPLGRFCGIPKGAESILVSAFLGGYPVGAQSIAAAYHSGQLKHQDAQRMLAFCSNAGPAFLFGMTASMFSDLRTVWILWGIHIFSALLVSRIFPASQTGPVTLSAKGSTTLTDGLTRGIWVMAGVCGWVVLFRVVIAFLRRWVLWLLPVPAQVTVIGLLELSNGCCSLLLVENETLRFLICAALLSFGGVCVAMQTMSVAAGLSLRFYYLGKLLQTVISLVICAAVVRGFGLPCCAVLLLLVSIPWLRKKSSSIPKTIGV